jgi:hypothetical protein
MIINLLKYYKRRKALKKSNFGRSEGWVVELNGRNIAEFINPIEHDQLRFIYNLSILDKSMEEELMSSNFWDRNDLKFFSKALNEYSNSIPIVNPKINKGKRIVRVRYLFC